MTLWLTDDDAANALLTEDALALLLGMLLDQRAAALWSSDASAPAVRAAAGAPAGGTL